MGENSLAFFCDAHFHLVPSFDALGEQASCAFRAVTAAHSQEEFFRQEEFVNKLNGAANQNDGKSKNAALSLACDQSCAPRLLQSFGLHPQEPLLQNLDFLEGLLREGRVQAVGECGYDFFNKEFSDKAAAQEKAFAAQVELAARYKVPAIVHARKAMEKIFASAAALKKVPAVVFHSFAGTPADARSLLDKGINSYFSFGKPLMNGAKKAIACVRSLPIERLLFETDAPYQTLKGELATSLAEIADVYQAAFEIRAAGVPFEARPSFADFAAAIGKNFCVVFGA